MQSVSDHRSAIIQTRIRIILFGFFALLLLAGLTLIGGKKIQAADAPKPINVFLDDQKVEFTIDPINEMGTTLVQMRPLFEALGMEVTWEASTRTVFAEKEGFSLTLILDSSSAVVNGSQMKLDRPATTVNSHTIVPLRFVSESTGALVHWNGVDREIIIVTEAYVLSLGTTLDQVKVLLDEAQKEIDERHAAEKKKEEDKKKKDKPSPPPSPVEKVDLDKLEGMYYGWESDFGGYECGGICWRFYTFLSGNKVVVGLPEGGGPETIDCKTDDCQTYSIKNGKLVLSGGESPDIGFDEYGRFRIDDVNLISVKAAADGMKLEGTYKAIGYTGLVGITPYSSSWTEYFTFKKDGTFESDRTSISALDVGSARTDATSAEDTVYGKYEIKGNTMVMKYADGSESKVLFIPEMEDGILASIQIGKRNFDLVTAED